MQVLVVIVEKDGTNYIARCPNLPGVSITAKTYEEAQNAILDAVEKRYNQILGMHADRKTIARLPIDESISCVYKYTDIREGDECLADASRIPGAG